MPICRDRYSIGQSSGANLGRSGTKIRDELRNDVGAVWAGERCPRGAGVGAVDGHFAQLARGGGGRDAGSELASEVEEESFGAAVLVGLL